MAFVFIYTFGYIFTACELTVVNPICSAVISCDKPSALYFYSHGSNKAILYWFFSLFLKQQQDYTQDSAWGQVNQGWH